jgi:hypothetical protein
MDKNCPAERSGASCNSCRRRKLKCDREVKGCSNCAKAEIPCLYPSPSTSIKRKRGPYHKEKTQRERELEHAVKVIEAKYNQLADQVRTQNHGKAEPSYPAKDGASASIKLSLSEATDIQRPVVSVKGYGKRVALSRVSSSDDNSSLKSLSGDEVKSTSKDGKPNEKDVRLKDRFWSNFSEDVSFHLRTSSLRCRMLIDISLIRSMD